MTEADWRRSAAPRPLLKFVQEKVSERKLRLLGCGVCRLVWNSFTDDRSRAAVDVAERYADGRASVAEMATAEQAASDARDLAVGYRSDAPRFHRTRRERCTSWAAYALAYVPPDDKSSVWSNVDEAVAYAVESQRRKTRTHKRRAATLARDIFGNPFRPTSLKQSWLGPSVVALAQAIYDGRQFDRLPEIGDAVAKAGCDDESVLDHCRSRGHSCPRLLGGGFAARQEMNAQNRPKVGRSADSERPADAHSCGLRLNDGASSTATHSA